MTQLLVYVDRSRVHDGALAELKDAIAELARFVEDNEPRLARFSNLLTLSSIHIYGEPSANALRQLHDKIHLLGQGEVVVHAHHAGFIRTP